MDESPMASGKLYRAWMDGKAAFSGGDKASVLSNCEAGEDAVQRAYKTAIADTEVREENTGSSS